MKNLIFTIVSVLLAALFYPLYFMMGGIYFLVCAILASIAAGVFFVLLFYRKEKNKIRELEERINVWNNLSYHVNQAGDEAVDNLPVGILVHEDGMIRWTNNYLKSIFKSRLNDQNLEDAIPSLVEKFNSKENTFVIQFENDYYEVMNYREQQVLYFFNVTEREAIKVKYSNRVSALGIIVLDNLEESLKEYDIQEKSTIRGLFLGQISDYVTEYGAYLQSYDNDRLVMFLDRESLDRMIQNKFDILNQARDIAAKNHMRVSLSIGVSCYDVEHDELGQIAQSAVEIAEKRGGDQVVVNIQGETLKYFGGKSNALEKNTLVTARVNSNALKEAVEASTNVFISGHIGADADCLGAMIGVLRMALASEKDAYIVFEIEKADKSIVKMYEKLKEQSPEIGERFIPLEDVDVKTNSLLIVCDTQSPSILMFPQLFDTIKRVVVIDHHRRGEIAFEDTIFSYVEPYASSTVELVSEMFSFYNKDIKFEPIEATCMLAGLVIDTNNFTFRTSARTFEAASIIKSLGADMINVRTLIRSSIEIEQEIANAIATAEIFLNKYAIAVLEDKNLVNDRSFLAQISDKLMNLDSVEASFAIGRLNSEFVGVSARSFEKINVQLIMEEMGGGGHLSAAAVQLTNCTTEEVKEKLCEILKLNNEDEGETKMKVILLEDVKGRGSKNQIIDVANGYGNFLITNNKAVLANEENVRKVEEQKAQAIIDEQNRLELMKKLKEDIESKSVNIYIKVGSDGKVFGHITNKQICEEYEAQTGIKLDKRKVTLPADINSVGIYTANVDLYKDVQASIKVHVLEK